MKIWPPTSPAYVMPSNKGGTDPLETALNASLGVKADLDNHIKASSLKKVLYQNIEFVEAEKPSVHQLNKLKSKYSCLKGQPEKSVFQKPFAVSGTLSKASTSFGTSNGNSNNNNISNNNNSNIGPVMNGGATSISKDCERSWNHDSSFPKPKLVLYEGDVDLQWKRWSKIGAGLHNMGNTCFLNSVLQCLTYTAPLTNWLMSGTHTQSCRVSNFCMMCELQRHIRRCLENSNQAIRPQPMISRIKSIAKHMQWGRQEDAHEFLRYVVEAMLKSCLDGAATKLDTTSKATTVVNKIFSGYLRSQVQCSNCKTKSNTYDPFLDISLDIKNVGSVEKALQKFVEPERLDGDNSYDCPKCARSCPATKRFTLHKPSNVLTIQLKRFDYNRMFGGKISRHISFKSHLDIRPYMSVKGEPVTYQLYAVLVHSGFGCNSGHYYCYVRAPNNAWYCMNDAHVSMCSFERVTQSEAYLLFYVRTVAKTPNAMQKPSQPMFAPVKKAHSLMNGAIHTNNNNNKFLAVPTNELAPLVKRPAPASSNNLTLPNQRGKISFDIIRPKQVDPRPSQQPPILAQKPRIVINTKRVVQDAPHQNNKLPMKAKLVSLVPYNGEDSDSPGKDSEEVKTNEVKLTKTPIPTEVPTAPERQEVTKPVTPKGQEVTRPAVTPKGQEVTRPVIPKGHDILRSVPMTPEGQTIAGNEDLKLTESKSTMSAPSSKKPLCTPKRFDGQLSLNTNAPRVNATSPWSVMYKDSAVSPSIGSESSNTSINSTTEWKILDRNMPLTPLVPQCQHPGWNVMNSPIVKPIVLKKCREELDWPAETTNDKKPLLEDVNDSKESRRKKKKRRKHMSDSSDEGTSVKYRRLSDESDFSVKKKKKKKKKHQHRSRKSSESDYEWVERTKETITEPLLSTTIKSY